MEVWSLVLFIFFRQTWHLGFSFFSSFSFRIVSAIEWCLNSTKLARITLSHTTFTWFLSTFTFLHHFCPQNPWFPNGFSMLACWGVQCTTIKFILGGRFKESKLFSEQKKRIGVFYLKSCRPSIFSLICERESDQNNRITGKITKISAGICRKWFSDWEKKAFSPIFAATVKMTLLWKNSINFLWIF